MKYLAVARSEFIFRKDKRTTVFATAARNPEMQQIAVKVKVKLAEKLCSRHDMVEKGELFDDSASKLLFKGGLWEMLLNID